MNTCIIANQDRKKKGLTQKSGTQEGRRKKKNLDKQPALTLSGPQAEGKTPTFGEGCPPQKERRGSTRKGRESCVFSEEAP